VHIPPLAILYNISMAGIPAPAAETLTARNVLNHRALLKTLAGRRTERMAVSHS
jgi:hypothetical protein